MIKEINFVMGEPDLFTLGVHAYSFTDEQEREITEVYFGVLFFSICFVILRNGGNVSNC